MVKVDLSHWNDFWNMYGKDVPWNVEEVDENLYEFVDKKKFDKILEIGCGAGSNTDFLADRCDSIISIDISSKAIDIAKELVDKKNVSFECVDFLNFSHNDKFDLIFDRGCLHGFERITDRRKFVKKISNLLSNRGEWVSLIGSAENVMDNEGPPQWKIMDIVKAVDKHLQIKEIKQCSLKNRNGILSPAWIVISSKRIV
jgi:SAM-dependent methyltransferase